MSSYNKVILMGRTGKDPEVKTLKDGKKVATFSLATDNFGKDKDGNQKQPDWHNVTVWDKQADFVEQYVKKGSSILVEGRLGYEDYEKDGVKRTYTRVTASSVAFAGSKKDSDDSGAPAASAPAKAAPAKAKPAPAAAPAAAPAEPAMADTDTSDDLPF